MKKSILIISLLLLASCGSPKKESTGLPEAIAKNITAHFSDWQELDYNELKEDSLYNDVNAYGSIVLHNKKCSTLLFIDAYRPSVIVKTDKESVELNEEESEIITSALYKSREKARLDTEQIILDGLCKN